VILPYTTELVVIGDADRGVPNHERVIMRPTETINLQEFIVTLAIRNTDGLVVPLHDNVFWFADRILDPPSWVILYTGPGEAKETVLDGQPAHIFHWGRTHTLLDDPRLTVVVFGLRSIFIPGQSSGPRESRLLPARS
jgi:hypothetical protein